MPLTSLAPETATRRARLLLLPLGAALGMVLAGCELLNQAAAGPGNEPATEATVIGTWRSNVPAPGGTSDIKITMRIDADHTMLLSQRIASSGPAEFVEIVHENWTWSLVDGKMKSVKTTCQYAPAPEYKLMDLPCQAPLEKEAPVNVKAGAWTVVEDGQPIVFRRD
jgi:hypothetical protein